MQAREQIEVMAPVGSWESLAAAIQAKADAIYFGIEQLNMRARSSNNFTTEDLKEIVKRCQKNNIKTYLTINTILYDHDLNLMKSIMRTAKEAGVSAAIIMDQAAIQYAREVGLPVHISTQLNITNIETVKFYAMFSDVMVLARELTLAQVKRITETIDKENITGPSGEKVRIEVFVHGALCMAVSGKCYMSLSTHNSSANRGACKQNCRREYTIKDNEGHELRVENDYIMSPKDLCTIEFLDQLLDAGVSVLKIEGRSKGPEYVKETVSCYKEAVEAVYDGSFSPQKAQEWVARLDNVYNRGFWDGYFLGKKLGEWAKSGTEGSISKRKKRFLGVGVKHFGKIGIGEFLINQGELNLGDEVMVTGPTTGVEEFVVTSLQVERKNVEKVERGTPFSMPVDFKLRPSDKLFKMITEE